MQKELTEMVPEIKKAANETKIKMEIVAKEKEIAD